MQDPSKNGYRSTCVELPSVRDFDIAVLVSEELCCRVRPSVGAWTCSYTYEPASWVPVFADVTTLVLFIEWVYSNNTWEAYSKNIFLQKKIYWLAELTQQLYTVIYISCA